MAVDHTPVAGFTVKIPKDELDTLLEIHDDLDDLFDNFDIDHATVGCSMSGNTEVIPLFEPAGVVGVEREVEAWLAKINHAFAVKLSLADVKFIKDVYVW